MGRGSFAALAALMLLSTPLLTLWAETKVPDLTRGGKPDKTHDWTLGPTGARGARATRPRRARSSLPRWPKAHRQTAC